MTEPKPFHKCTESCPLFGYSKKDDEMLYFCFVGNEPQFDVKYGQKCPRSFALIDKRQFIKLQRELERERDKITTKIYHLQLLIDNCGSE